LGREKGGGGDFEIAGKWFLVRGKEIFLRRVNGFLDGCFFE
jgi:hypothetical protein